ncbi:MAG: glycosyltransferase [bacterium]|nr:glycosyltransferase [bacterium]
MGTKTPLLALCLVVKDQILDIAACIASVEDLVDEVVVLDTGSSDLTPNVARIMGASVYDFPWSTDPAAARNAANRYVLSDWILSLDADERIGAEDLATLRRSIETANDDTLAFDLEQLTYTDETHRLDFRPATGALESHADGHAGHVATTTPRLFRNRADVQFGERTREVVASAVERVGGRIIRCPVAIHHYGALEVPDAPARDRGPHLLRPLVFAHAA